MEEREDPAKQVNRALWMYSALVMLTTLSAWGIYFASGRKWYLRPLFFLADRYHDLLNYYGKIAHLRDGAVALGAGLPIYNYEAPGAYVYQFLIFGLGGRYEHRYMYLLAATAAILALLAWKASRVWGYGRSGAAAAILTTLVLGYPLWFAIDRGNIEGVVWIFTSAGLYFLLRRRYWMAAALVGAASSIKPFPILFLFPLLWHKRFKEAAFGAAVAAVLVVSALWALGPNPWRAYNDLKPGFTLYMDTFVDHIAFPDQIRAQHSLLDGLKTIQIIHETGDLSPRDEFSWPSTVSGFFEKVDPITRLYLPMTLVGLGLVFFFFARMPLVNQVTAAGIAVTLFPLSAVDYTLLHLYVPFGCFVIFAVREVAAGSARFSRAALFTLAAIYALLFAPLTFLKLYAGDAKMLLLIALLVAVARWPMRSSYFSDAPVASDLPIGVPSPALS